MESFLCKSNSCQTAVKFTAVSKLLVSLQATVFWADQRGCRITGQPLHIAAIKAKRGIWFWSQINPPFFSYVKLHVNVQALTEIQTHCSIIHIVSMSIFHKIDERQCQRDEHLQPLQ